MRSRKVFAPFWAAVLQALLALPLICAAVGPAWAERRLALVIGNDHYQSVPQLQKAVNDARAIGQTLKGLGFTVTVGEDLTQRRMSEQLVTFATSVKQGDIVLFFFSGHGFEMSGENFLLPVDVPPAMEGQDELVRDASFPAQRIIDQLQQRGARTAILVLDACRDNPFDRPGRTRGVGGSGGLAPMNAVNEGVFVLFSAGAKQTALDRLSDSDANPNSVFTRNFVHELATPGLSLVQVAKRTQSEVLSMARSVRHEQTPAYYDQVIGDIVLNGSSADTAANSALAPQLSAVSMPVAPLPQGPTSPPTSPPPAALPQVAAFPPIAPGPLKPSEPVNGPIASFMRSNSGWSATFSFVDPVTAITWRLGETGEFRETGFLDSFDSRTRKRMPNSTVQFDGDTPANTIYVRYADDRGQWSDPFPIRFDPGAALERSDRKILEMTSGSWVSFGGYNAVLLYYTQLMSFRCGIREAHIGVDSSIPDKLLPMPACNPKDPNSIPDSATPYVKMPPNVKSVSVELTYRDGTTSEVKTFRR